MTSPLALVLLSLAVVNALPHLPKQADCPRIISRAQWGAVAPSGSTAIGNNLPYMFVHHAETPGCFNQADCMARVRQIQDYHMNTNGWSDIGYSFLIGGDGNIYEGRGWNVQGAHTSGYNSNGYGTCFIGSFIDTIPDAAAVNNYMQLATCATTSGKVSASYEMYGHRQVGSTDCPGDQLYSLIQSWPHWTSGSP